MNSVLRARASVAVLVAALVATFILAAATSIDGRALGWACLSVVTVSGGVALWALFNATLATGRAPFYWGMSGGVGLVAGFIYFGTTADEPSAIPIAGFAFVLYGLIALVVSVMTPPSRTS